MRVRIALPAHLRTLARVDGEVEIEVSAPVTVESALAALEARFPMLNGTIREHGTGRRRAYMRYFACGRDISHDPVGDPLPEPIVRGEEPLIVIGAISGG
jgi:sulfur-carrier protein